MGEIFRAGKSGQLYKANIAGTTPTAQELEQFNKLVAAQGDTRAIPRQHQRDVLADTAPAAGNQCDFTVQIELH